MENGRLLNPHLDATVLFLLSSHGSPLDSPVFLGFFSSFFFKSLRNTLLSRLNPVGGKVSWSLCYFQTEQKPRQLSSPNEGGIKIHSLGLEGQ